MSPGTKNPSIENEFRHVHGKLDKILAELEELEKLVKALVVSVGNGFDEVQRSIRALSVAIGSSQDDQNAKLDQILTDLSPEAASATLTIRTDKGEGTLLTVKLNDKPGTAVFQEWDGPNGTGNKLPPVGTVSYASDNPAVATVDPASGALAYVSVGTANISGTDSGNGMTASDALTVTAAGAVSATLTLTPGA